MDNALLVPVVTELRDGLVGSKLGDIIQIDSRRFAMRFDVPPFHRVEIDLHPEAGALHLVRRAPTPAEGTELAAVLTGALGGMPLRAISKEPDERVVEMEFGDGWSPGRFLIIELLGKSSNLLLLDGERRIVRFLRSHGGSFRHPEAGSPYQPPPARDSGLPLGSRLLQREVQFRERRGEDAAGASERLLSAMAEARWEPVLYTPSPPERIGEPEELPAPACFASPFPLACGEGLHETRFETVSRAVEAHASLLRRHIGYRDLRSTLSGMLAAQVRKLEKLLLTLEAEAGKAAASEETRRRGELLLASLSTAKKQGDFVEVVDYFDPRTPRVRIPIDPSLDLKSNAERLFRLARKQERAVAAIARRRKETLERLERARGFLGGLGSAATSEELRELESRLDRSGALGVVRRPGRTREKGRRGFMRVKEYRTADGRVLLVGRGAEDNDLLTFKVAAPHDFWLHAAGRSGAHVVVRNPKRERELPPAVLEEAAAVAAWFSRGDRQSPIEVHVTRRKEVRKRKGMSPGMVMLRAYRTVRVRPAPPKGGTVAEPRERTPGRKGTGGEEG